VAVKLIPISDYVVFSFTTPVVTLVIGASLICFPERKKLTVTNIGICLMILLGACLVAQPSFLFPKGTSDSVTTHGGGEYLAGVGIVLSATAACASANILQSHFTQIPSAYFMLCGGVVALITGPIVCLCLVTNHDTGLLEDFINSSLPHLTLVSSFSVTAGLLVLLALKTTSDPVLISVVRSTEIVMGLLLDIYLSATSRKSDPNTTDQLDFHSPSFAIKVLGSAMVTAGAIIMPFAEKIHANFSIKFRKWVKGDLESS